MIRTLAGPSVYTYAPAVLMQLDLEELNERESRELSGFNARLLELLPGLRTHHCSLGRPGGFVERLEEGTYFGHVVEHVALELMTLAGAPATHGKTRHAGEPGVYNVVVEFKAEEATKYLLGVAVELVEALAAGESFEVVERLEEAKPIMADTELGPSTRAIVEAAAQRGIPWFRLDKGSLVQFGYGKARRLIRAATTERTSAVAVDVASDKDLTKTLLVQASIPVPRGRVAASVQEAVAALEEFGRVVVKPLDGRQGKGVSLNLSTAEEVERAYEIAREFSSLVLVEEMFEGRNYRVLVVGGRMVAASERTPCHVLGDGRSTVAELIERANCDEMRGEGHEKPLTKIKVDEISREHLRKNGRSLSDVPAAGEVVTLRESVNLSTGGTAKDVTDVVHPTVARACERAARAVGMDVCGVDLILEDISAPLNESVGGVIELNAAPGLRMHLFPSEGKPRDVGRHIVEMLYPEGENGRIPITAITGTNGKTTVTRMIGHVLSSTGLVVGVTTTDGIWIGGELIVEGDTTGPHSARVVLSDPSVEAAVLETARGGIARRGLGYDWSDVAVMTNIQPDHFGQDNVESLEDLTWVKSLVAERVREGGTLVLNADDEILAHLPENERVRRVEKRIVYFSLRESHVLIRRHVAAGGTAYVVRDGWVVELEGQAERPLFKVASVPVTMGGVAEFQVANVLAAAAACRAQGVAAEQVASALANFRGAECNPGRTNLYRLAAGGYVLLDYGHNPEAFKSICQTAAAWTNRRVTAIIGAPGDRCDDLIREAGRVAARGFSRIVIKEDHDLRGRRPGEVAELLRRTVKEEAPEADCRIVLDEVEALSQELRTQGPDDVIVMFYDKLKPLLDVLERHGAEPVSNIGVKAPRGHAEAATYGPDSPATYGPDVAAHHVLLPRTAPGMGGASRARARGATGELRFHETPQGDERT